MKSSRGEHYVRWGGGLDALEKDFIHFKKKRTLQNKICTRFQTPHVGRRRNGAIRGKSPFRPGAHPREKNKAEMVRWEGRFHRRVKS